MCVWKGSGVGLYDKILWKWVYFKRKAFAPMTANSFLYDFKLNAIDKAGINKISRADSADNILIYLIH